MKIIVGLGNPGHEYQLTRHNLGFIFVDYLVVFLNRNRSFDEFKSLSLKNVLEEAKSLYKNSKKTSSLLFQQKDLILIKPQTYMNDSGTAVQAVLKYYCKDKVNSAIKKKNFIKNVYVAHDDLDIEANQFKVQFDKGPRTHNGLLSIYTHLQSSAFWHVRLGADDRHGDRSIPAKNLVLNKMTVPETVKVQQLMIEVLRYCTQYSFLSNKQ